MPGGGNGAGPGMHDLGGVPGVCGDPFQSMTDIRTNFLNEPCSIQETVPEGSEYTVTVELSNQHGGYFEFAICPESMGPTEECFEEYVLMTESGSTEYWAQPTPQSGSISVDNREVYNVKVQLPEGLTCEHCTLMWTWWTSHTCTYDCDPEICGAYANFNNPMPTGGSGPPCRSRFPNKGETPQMFRACGDIAIVAADGSAMPDMPTGDLDAAPMPAMGDLAVVPAADEPATMPDTAMDMGDGMETPSVETGSEVAGVSDDAAGACGGENQPVCTDLTDREFECDEGLVVKYGMCMKYAMGASASPVPAPAADAAIMNVMEEDDEAEVVSEDTEDEKSDDMDMDISDDMSDDMPMPASADDNMMPAETPDDETPKTLESMPAQSNCGALGGAACTTEPYCNEGLKAVNLGGASTICRKDNGRRLASLLGSK